MDRKDFLNTGIIFGAAALSKGCTPLVKNEPSDPLPDYLSEIPISCSHEHWGSLTHIGFEDAGFVATTLGRGVFGEELVELPSYTALISLLQSGNPVPVFTLQTIPPSELGSWL